MRLPQEGEYSATARSAYGHAVTAKAKPSASEDWCVQWRLSGLKPKTSYVVTFQVPTDRAAAHRAHRAHRGISMEPGRVALGFGSCVEFPANRIWTRAADECPDGFVLLGDSPYIDTTKQEDNALGVPAAGGEPDAR